MYPERLFSKYRKNMDAMKTILACKDQGTIKETMKRLIVLSWGLATFHVAVAQTAYESPERPSLTGAGEPDVNVMKKIVTGTEESYVTRVMKKIRSNVAYDDRTDHSGNPRVVYRVLLLPGGEVMSVDRILSSGVEDFDMAVQKGILNASPLPTRNDGKV